MSSFHAVKKLIERQLLHPDEPSFHEEYKGSAAIYIGNLGGAETMTRSALAQHLKVVFSQWGTVVHVDVPSSKEVSVSSSSDAASEADKHRGMAFLVYEDARSAVLAVDNAHGIQLCGRNVKVDHVKEYYQWKKRDGDD